MFSPCPTTTAPTLLFFFFPAPPSNAATPRLANTSARSRRARRSGIITASATQEGDSDNTSSGSSSSSARNQLDLLEQLSSSPPTSPSEIEEHITCRLTIREQLSELVRGRVGEFTLPLGKKLMEDEEAKSLTTSQKRNIKRQAYLTEVSGRNDSTFFATIASFVILPPLAILAIAVLTGYVDLLP